MRHARRRVLRPGAAASRRWPACSSADGAGRRRTGLHRRRGHRHRSAAAARDEPVRFRGTTLDGGTFDVADHRGEVVVVNVWGSWCPPCIAEAPDLQEVWSEVRGRGVQFVGVDFRDNTAAARAHERRFGVTYPSIEDQAGRVLLALRGSLPPRAIPSTLVLDRRGRVAARVLGQVRRLDAARARRRRARRGRRRVNLQGTITDGSLLLALPLALAAGVVSFLSPCVLPLVPGYLSYVTGLTRPRCSTRPARRRGRLLAGSGAVRRGLHRGLRQRRRPARRLRRLPARQRAHRCSAPRRGDHRARARVRRRAVPWLQRDLRVHRRPALGLVGAPCSACSSASAGRPASARRSARCMALGLDERHGRARRRARRRLLPRARPAVPRRRARVRQAMGAFAWVRRHHVWVMRARRGACSSRSACCSSPASGRDITRWPCRSWVTGFTPAV